MAYCLVPRTALYPICLANHLQMLAWPTLAAIAISEMVKPPFGRPLGRDLLNPERKSDSSAAIVLSPTTSGWLRYHSGVVIGEYSLGVVIGLSRSTKFNCFSLRCFECFFDDRWQFSELFIFIRQDYYSGICACLTHYLMTKPRQSLKWRGNNE